MKLSKNKRHQYIFFLILSLYTVFNGGNSNLSIQINFIFISLLFLYCFKDKNYYSHLKIFYLKNKFFFHLLKCPSRQPFFDIYEFRKYQMVKRLLHKVHIFYLQDHSYFNFGAGKGGRTLDLLVGNETLYH